jgi:hypothetical protein
MTEDAGCRSANSLSRTLVLLTLSKGVRRVHRPDPRPRADIEDFLVRLVEFLGQCAHGPHTCTSSFIGAIYSFPWSTRL